jgi:hypothetical protein
LSMIFPGVNKLVVNQKSVGSISVACHGLPKWVTKMGNVIAHWATTANLDLFTPEFTCAVCVNFYLNCLQRQMHECKGDPGFFMHLYLHLHTSFIVFVCNFFSPRDKS